MIDFNTAEKKLDLIWMKYELITYFPKDFMEIYNREDLYYELLFRLETIMVLESDFLLLKDYLDKYREIINVGRFRYHTKGKIREYENLTLTTLNSLEQTKEKYRTRYIKEQLKIRYQMHMVSNIENYDEEIVSLSEFDYRYLSIMNQLIHGVSLKNTEKPSKYLSSINYLISCAPEVFFKEQGYINATTSILDIFVNNKLIQPTHHVKKIMRKLNHMNEKR